jgi:hypothetical protein
MISAQAGKEMAPTSQARACDKIKVELGSAHEIANPPRRSRSEAAFRTAWGIASCT